MLRPPVAKATNKGAMPNNIGGTPIANAISRAAEFLAI
jgi:hypothetical protein